MSVSLKIQVKLQKQIKILKEPVVRLAWLENKHRPQRKLILEEGGVQAKMVAKEEEEGHP